MSIYNEVKAELGDGPPYVSRAQFKRVHGYTRGTSLGLFDTAIEAREAGATVIETVCDEGAFSIANNAYNAHQGAILDEWKRRVRAEYPDVNDAVFEIVYARAYEDGHASGLGEVEIYVDEYVDWATSIIAAARS